MKIKYILNFILVILLIVLSPYFLYWWGLSNIKDELTPSDKILSKEQKISIWVDAKEYGNSPKLKQTNPYSYIMFLYCELNKEPTSNKCSETQPGLKVSALSIRNKVRERVGEYPSSLKWQLTWLSYTIWVTNNWNIQQVLSTYNEQYSA